MIAETKTDGRDQSIPQGVISSCRSSLIRVRDTGAAVDDGREVFEADVYTEAPLYNERARIFEIIALDEMQTAPDNSGEVPLVFQHRAIFAQDVLGVVNNFRRSSSPGVITADIRFGTNTAGREARKSVIDKTIKYLSIGFDIVDYKRVGVHESGAPIIKATKWIATEVSLAIHPKDPIARFRSEVNEMDPEKTVETETQAAQPPVLGNNINAASDVISGVVFRHAMSRARSHAIPIETVESWLTPGVDCAGIDAKVLDFIGSNRAQQPAQQPAQQAQLPHAGREAIPSLRATALSGSPGLGASGAMQAGGGFVSGPSEHPLDRQIRFAEAALLEAAGIKHNEPSDGVRRYRGMTLSQVCRAVVAESDEMPSRELGYMTSDVFASYAVRSMALYPRERNYYAGERMVYSSVRSAPMGTVSGSLPILLSNVMGKSAMAGYEAVETHYDKIVRHVSVPDFKEQRVIQLAGSLKFKRIHENGQFEQGSVSERYETYRAYTYGRAISFSRELMVNDDLGMLTQVPYNFGIESRMAKSMAVYSLLLANSGTGVTLADGYNIFDASNHANYVSSGVILGATSLDTAETAFSQIRSFNSEQSRIYVRPRYLIVPPAIQNLAYTLLNATTVVGATNEGVPNYYRNRYELISEPMIDSNGFEWDGATYTGSNTHWYLLSDPNVVPTLILAHLNGVEAPVMSSEVNANNVLGMTMHAYTDFGVGAGGYRGLYRNVGASS